MNKIALQSTYKRVLNKSIQFIPKIDAFIKNYIINYIE
jgi:hypothetical protein